MKIIELWYKLLVWLGIRKPLYRYLYVQDFPDEWNEKTVYLLGKPSNEWLAGLLCPCGCKKKIELVLLPEERPRWHLTIHKKGTLSLRPSVWLTKGCKSHFFLTKGDIKWCD